MEGVLAGSQSIVLLAEDIARRAGNKSVVHIPFVLYHDALEARVRHSSIPNVDVPDHSLPSVSIIIPTRDRVDLLKPCLDSIVELTDYPANKLEILVLDNGSTDPTTVRYLARQSDTGAVRVVLDERRFNYSGLNNLGAREAKSEILLFLNNDTIVNDSNWLKQIVLHAIQKDVGAVGSKLLFDDRKVQHGGVILGLHGLAAHAHVGLAENDGGYHNLANETHEISAVTGACLAVRREVFDEVGGFDTSLQIAFSDVLLCAKMIERGYRNIYIGKPLLFHLESKTRGYDDTPEKKSIFQREAKYARSQCRSLFRNDPYYNPNLSYHQPYGLAFPPRRRKPWQRLDGKLRVLMLSSTCEIGHGVAVVLNLQAEYLAQLGHDVLIGGPRGANEFAFEGCRRVHLEDPAEAAVFAVANDVNCIVAHTPPFFSVARWTGEWPKCILYDYGEPDPNLFEDADARRDSLEEKRFVFEMAHRTYAISRSVKIESVDNRMEVIPLGNSHLAVWNDELSARRDTVRAQRGWTDKVVVLNVCRFHKAERAYKGVERYALILDDLIWTRPTLASDVVFVLCGKATQQDIIDMEAQGLVVCANLSDAELIDLYCAADIYMNFSRWEGYNLGIGQALAFGLPVIASDIPAHREFGVSTADDSDTVLELLAPLIERSIASGHKPKRKPVLWTWDEPLKQFAAAIEAVCLE
jgi:GT2 family glycosyltransferase